MKPIVCQLSLVLLAAAAAPCALAGPDILKCVDSGGHVTLTDQPCPAGSRVTLVIPDAGPAARPPERGTTQVGGSGAAGATGSGGEETTAPAPAAERLPPPPPPPRGRYKPPSKPTPLSRDEATLKAARLKMMINDDQIGRQAAQ
jgi:hypothetical protein